MPTQTEPTKRGRGGRRPGAGAPKGNLNAMKHGRHSVYQKRITEALIAIPEVAVALEALARRRRQQKRQAEAGAALLLGELLKRTGEIVLTPENSQAENNKQLLGFLRAAEAEVMKILAAQSKEQPK